MIASNKLYYSRAEVWDQEGQAKKRSRANRRKMGSELESARARVVNLELEPIRSYFRTGRGDEAR